jgi:putative hydrolase of the HAD superfamily
MRVEAVLFDLDDTLYVEGDFFRGGFREVARTLAATGKPGEAESIVRELEAIHFGEGRDQVFDKLAQRRALPRESVPGLVHLFRIHSPRIRLLSEVPALLARLRGKGYRLGCVTDGWPDVQRRKVEALGLAPLLDTVVYTGDYGPRRGKPDPFGFVACCARLGVGTGSAVHVGDHPERDVRGARRAGMVSVRVRDERGYFRDRTGEGDPPDFEIRAIDELEGVLEAIAGDAPPPAETRSAVR